VNILLRVKVILRPITEERDNLELIEKGLAVLERKEVPVKPRVDDSEFVAEK
jgi:hypothetical protein